MLRDPEGRRVAVRITRCNGGQVRLAIDAPREVEIVREELLSDEEDAAA